MLSFDVSPLSIGLLLISAFFILLAVSVGLLPLMRVGRRGSAGSAEDMLGEVTSGGKESSLPLLSVVVYATSPEDELDEYLGILMDQDYPRYEVVMVYEADAEAASTVAEKYAPLYPNLYVTFIPAGSHNLSRRKLAFTLGMKAAKGDYVLTTFCNCVIPSRSWLSEMMVPVVRNRHREIVLGAAMPDFSEMKGAGKWFRQFDTVISTCRWLGSALGGHPYRGDSCNLMIKRSLFFAQKGYSKSMNLHYGEDDLFVHDIAREGNTAEVYSPDSILTVSWKSSANKMWSYDKGRYMFTSRWLPKGPYLRSGFLSCCQWIVPLSAAGALFMSWFNLWTAIAAGVLLLLFWGTEISVYRKAAGRLGAVRLWWSVPVFMLYHPLANFFFRFSHRYEYKRNYTWQR